MPRFGSPRRFPGTRFRIQQQLGTTSIYVTHDQAEAMALSHVVVVMNSGRSEQAVPPDAAYRHPETRFVADFIGRANFLSGEILAVGDDTVDVSMMGVAMQIPAGAGNRVGDTATVVVRPKSFSIDVGDLRATMKGNTFLGSYVEYELALRDGQDDLLAIDGDWMSRGLHAPGEEVAWELLPERASVLPRAPEDVSSD